MNNDNCVVSVENVAVRFNLANQKVDNLKEYLIKLMKRELFFHEFFALQEIDLKIMKGEAWAIIGNNGSGKSTLLKLICGILKPYSGRVFTKGTIAPIIELGAGFNSELTGRENIYLNGAVLGHGKRFLAEHFNEIVDFAELKEFIDVPLKNYSSGMRARLGFAIATVIKPDILIIDEVLAVGDRDFRKKCMQRMQELLDEKTTLIYVSHDMESVKSLCQKALWLEKGRVRMQGEATAICRIYETV